MTYDGPLRSGAAPDPDDWVVLGPDAPVISQRDVVRIADAILDEERHTGAAPSTTPLEPNVRSGVPQGYGTWGDLA